LRKKIKLKLSGSELKKIFYRTFSGLKEYKKTQTSKYVLIDFKWHDEPFRFLISVKDGEIKESSDNFSAVLAIKKQQQIDFLKGKIFKSKKEED